ncbi:MAG: hypothetical protein ABIG39_06270 [Candidatus Micrarchaeota archaeon]
MNPMKMDFKNYGLLDIAMVKSAVFFATLGLVSLVPAFANWVTGTHWALFFAIGIILSVKPLIKSWK